MFPVARESAGARHALGLCRDPARAPCMLVSTRATLAKVRSVAVAEHSIVKGKGSKRTGGVTSERLAASGSGRPSLLIVESPAKASKIQKFLGEGYQVGGHSSTLHV